MGSWFLGGAGLKVGFFLYVEGFFVDNADGRLLYLNF
jgi:hypothetical protein